MIRKFHGPRKGIAIIRKGLLSLLVIEIVFQVLVFARFVSAEAFLFYRRYTAKQNNWFIRQKEQQWWNKDSYVIDKNTRFDPFLGFLTTNVATPNVTVDGRGARKTIGNPEPSKTARSVYLFGGSTMAGYYAKDDETIASYVAKELNKDGPRVVIVNFGQTAFVNSQELIYFLLQLRRGERPDLVVFYDGCNELSLATTEDPFQQIPYERRFSYGPKQSGNSTLISPEFLRDVVNRIQIIRFIKKVGSLFFPINQATVTLADRTKKIVTTYTENMSVVDNLSRSYGFSYAFVWQPMSFTKPLTEDEKKIFVVTPSEYQSMGEIYGGATEQLTSLRNPNFYDLTQIFSNDKNQSIFIDSCHVSPQGSARIASEISAIIRKNFGWEK